MVTGQQESAQDLSDGHSGTVIASICVCTYRRPEGLRRLLDSFTRQQDAPPFEVVIVDNDPAHSARDIAESFRDRLSIQYVNDPSACLATIRNHSIRVARGAYLAFADDDEEVVGTWLATHHRILNQTGAVAASGPVRYEFDERVPPGIRQCRLFKRPEIPAGKDLPWFWAFTGNAYVRRSALPDQQRPFREHYGSTGGEDVDCFKKMVDAGGRLVMSGPDAMVIEHREYDRARYAWVLRRALRNGGNLSDMQWAHETRWARFILALRSLKQGLSQAWRARRLAKTDSLAFVEMSIDASVNFGRFLSVFGYRYPEYGARR
jgi:glycosyltransferase involved in cell wall biosynthesis